MNKTKVSLNACIGCTEVGLKSVPLTTLVNVYVSIVGKHLHHIIRKLKVAGEIQICLRSLSQGYIQKISDTIAS